MRKIQLTSLLLLICINSIVCQNTIELIAFDCNREKSSNSDISEIKFKIITEHKVITDTTKLWLTQYKFQTFKNKVEIEYHNIFNQKVDTIFNITSKKQKIYLCIERMKDYEVETFLETSISKNKKWKLEFSSLGCSGKNKTTIEIIPRKKKTLFKYSSVDKWWKSGKK
jgi:hypothetical protein